MQNIFTENERNIIDLIITIYKEKWYIVKIFTGEELNNLNDKTILSIFLLNGWLSNNWLEFRIRRNSHKDLILKWYENNKNLKNPPYIVFLKINITNDDKNDIIDKINIKS